MDRMTETPPQPEDSKDKKKEKRLPSLLEMVRKYRTKKENAREQDEARNLTEWALMQFTSGDIKASKKAIYPNKHQQDMQLHDLIDKQTSVVRVEGRFRHKREKHFWFIFVNMNGNFYITNINTQGVDMEVLEPRMEGYSLTNTEKIDDARVTEMFPIEYIINFLYEYPFDEDFSRTDKIDIMFSGSPETAKKSKEKSKLSVLELASESAVN